MSRHRGRRLAPVLAAFLLVGSAECSGPGPGLASTSRGAASAGPAEGYAHGLGRNCFPPGSPSAKSRLAYRALDAGKPGVPALDKRQRRWLDTIGKYVPRSHLWFVITTDATDDDIAIFRGGSKSFACSLGTQVLNDSGCNAVFDALDGTLSVSSGCVGQPARPWFPSDLKDGAVRDPSAWSS